MFFYLQDSRSYVGNDMLFWATLGGYTSDVSKAQTFSQEKAVAQHERRDTDIPWPKDYIDARTRLAVDMQYVKHAAALAGTGIVLQTVRRGRRGERCVHCGVFLSAVQRYIELCPKCDGDNAP